MSKKEENKTRLELFREKAIANKEDRKFAEKKAENEYFEYLSAKNFSEARLLELTDEEDTVGIVNAIVDGRLHFKSEENEMVYKPTVSLNITDFEVIVFKQRIKERDVQRITNGLPKNLTETEKLIRGHLMAATGLNQGAYAMLDTTDKNFLLTLIQSYL